MIRRIARWYSREFNTPLPEVEKVPLHDLLVAYWEDHYENLTEDQQLEEAAKLAKDDSDVKKMEDLDAAISDEFLKSAESENERAELEQVADQAAKLATEIEDTFASLAEIQKIEESDGINII